MIRCTAQKKKNFSAQHPLHTQHVSTCFYILNGNSEIINLSGGWETRMQAVTIYFIQGYIFSFHARIAKKIHPHPQLNRSFQHPDPTQLHGACLSCQEHSISCRHALCVWYASYHLESFKKSHFSSPSFENFSISGLYTVHGMYHFHIDTPRGRGKPLLTPLHDDISILTLLVVLRPLVGQSHRLQE